MTGFEGGGHALGGVGAGLLMQDDTEDEAGAAPDYLGGGSHEVAARRGGGAGLQTDDPVLTEQLVAGVDLGAETGRL
ncbi:hypothetical protein [Streptomyces xanthophaeus]